MTIKGTDCQVNLSGMPAYVYILASKKNGTLYVGVTSDLPRRMAEHKTGAVEGFTKKYGVTALVYAEQHADIKEAIAREKVIKKWNRDWKLHLIQKANPQWQDLAPELA